VLPGQRGEPAGLLGIQGFFRAQHIGHPGALGDWRGSGVFMRLPPRATGNGRCVRRRGRWGGSRRMHTDSRSDQPPRPARSGSPRFGQKPLVIAARVSLVMERRKRGSG
jgi:hypothetical protein